MGSCLRYTKAYLTRHPLLTLASVFSLFFAFFAGLVFVSLTYLSLVLVNHFESKAQLSAYLADTATEEQISQLQTALLRKEEVARVEFISKQQAKAFFIQQNEQNQDILQALDDSANPFPASLEIEPRRLDDLEAIAQFLKTEPIVEDTSYHKNIVDGLRHWLRNLQLGGLVVLVAFSAVSLLVVLITVGLTIFSKKEEIEIMKLLGARPAFIRAPFILQGVIYGLIASTLSLLVGGGAVLAIQPKLKLFFFGVRFPYLDWQALALAGAVWLAGGCLLGGAISWLATIRYLKR